MLPTNAHRPRGFVLLGALLAPCLGGALAGATARADPLPFAGRVAIESAALGARAAASGDLDGDGVLDIVTASAGDDTVAWHAGVGGGGFGARQVITATAVGASDVAVADLDSDGDVDVAVSSAGDATLAWYENTGAGSSWTHHVLSSGATDARGIFPADVDGNGRLDVVAVSAAEDRVSWFANPGAVGAWTEHTIDVDADGPGAGSGFSDGAADVAVADLDRDGALDVVVASPLDDSVAWYRNTAGDGTSWTAANLTTSALGAASLAIGDPDRDGDLDVAVASAGDDRVRWLENAAGDGTSWVAQLVSSGVSGARGVSIADVDGDGDDDLLSAAETSGTFAWHENTAGDGSAWTDHPLPSTGVGAANIAAADLDGDGDRDVVAISQGDDTVAWFENARLHRSGVTDLENILSLTADNARDVTAADLDRDGDLDVISASEIADEIVWYENRGPLPFLAHSVTTTANGAFGVAAGDVDGDGDLDLLAAAAADHTIAWYPNTDGAGAFGARQVIANAILSARTVAAADLDRDGDLDAVSASSLDDQIAWYENLAGDGSSWATHSISFSADSASDVIVTDVNGDGFPDLVSASAGDDKIAWYESDGAGPPGFTERIVTNDPDGAGGSQGFADGAHGVAAGDADGDGDTDLFSASAHDDTIAWYENTAGDGTLWTEHVISAAARDARSVFVVDMDGDGDLDALSASKDDHKVAWYENVDGDASVWLEYPITTAADKAFSVFAADLDGDGDPDALSASRDDDKIAWYENRGGQFALTTTDIAPILVVEGATHALLAVDVKHRGRPGDSSLELVGLELGFEASPGVPLTSGELTALITGLSIYRDDGSGGFEAGSDDLVTFLGAFSLSPAGLETLSFVDGDPAVEVFEGASVRFFVVVDIAPAAASAIPNAFRVLHDGPASGTSAEDRDADLLLRREAGEEGVATLDYVATATSDADLDGLLDRHETNTGVFVSPVDTGTNPFESDTDGDGVGDGDEVLAGTDPNQAGVGGLGPAAAGLLAFLLALVPRLAPFRHAGGSRAT